jgi:hypothetical protein
MIRLIIFTLLVSLPVVAKAKKGNEFLKQNIKLTEGSRMQLAKYLRQNKKSKTGVLLSMKCAPSKATTKCEFIQIEDINREKGFTVKSNAKLDKLMKK